ncbi:MAG: acylphosphatase [Acidobacteriota bacterium]|nr:acylphosphatase [Acidobacteriota bacterium]
MSLGSLSPMAGQGEAAVIVARHYVVAGRVQGVGYRFFARAAATREGLSGFVRNRGDGHVEVEVEGEHDALTRFERVLHEGPLSGRVDQVSVTEILPGASSTGFHIVADVD